MVIRRFVRVVTLTTIGTLAVIGAMATGTLIAFGMIGRDLEKLTIPGDNESELQSVPAASSHGCVPGLD